MKSELNSTINQVAHLMAGQSFNTIRLRLREQARTMLKAGRRPDEVVRAIQETDLRGDMPEPSTQPK
jgi:hypothetical protein